MNCYEYRDYLRGKIRRLQTTVDNITFLDNMFRDLGHIRVGISHNKMQMNEVDDCLVKCQDKIKNVLSTFDNKDVEEE